MGHYQDLLPALFSIIYLNSPYYPSPYLPPPLPPPLDIILSISFSFSALISVKNNNLEVLFLIRCAAKQSYLYYDVLHVLRLFLPIIREIRLGGFKLLDHFRIGYIELVFKFAYQT